MAARWYVKVSASVAVKFPQLNYSSTASAHHWTRQPCSLVGTRPGEWHAALTWQERCAQFPPPLVLLEIRTPDTLEAAVSKQATKPAVLLGIKEQLHAVQTTPVTAEVREFNGPPTFADTHSDLAAFVGKTKPTRLRLLLSSWCWCIICLAFML